MASLADDLRRFDGRRVLITGLTGFKGSWLALLLVRAGAHVTGVSLPPETSPSHYAELGLDAHVDSRICDVRDIGQLERIFTSANPEVVFHLAAQAFVRLSYQDPLRTFSTNVLGSANVLQCSSTTRSVRTVVFVTSDKCYRNIEVTRGYVEADELGGRDPYSASKAAAELVFSGYNEAVFKSRSDIRIARARAGNVIGGGDWSPDRLVPDCIRALESGVNIDIRNPDATRPWQHVLEPLGGYLELASRLLQGPIQGEGSPGDAAYAAFNFGPGPESERSVQDLVEEVLKSWSGTWENKSYPSAPHEAHRLSLDVSKVACVLDWHPRWDFTRTIRETVDWYRAASDCHSPADFQSLTDRQIADYNNASTAHA